MIFTVDPVRHRFNHFRDFEIAPYDFLERIVRRQLFHFISGELAALCRLGRAGPVEEFRCALDAMQLALLIGKASFTRPHLDDFVIFHEEGAAFISSRIQARRRAFQLLAIIIALRKRPGGGESRRNQCR